MNAAMSRVLLIDGGTLSRECLAGMLRRHARGFALASVADAAEADSGADAVLLNIGARRLDDATVQRQMALLAERCGGVPLLLISDRDDSQMALEALRRGARGFLPTSLGARLLAAAVGVVLAGGRFVPERLIADYAAAARLATPVTPREAEVLALLRQGTPNKLIAHELGIAQSTVKVHVRRIMRKLRARNRTQLAALAAAAERPAA